MLLVPIPSGEAEVVVTGEALEVRRYGQPFQDGASLRRYCRSFLAEIAKEKLQLSGACLSVILTGADDAD